MELKVARRFYERHDRALDFLFFAAGFGFDVFASRVGVDHGLLIVQQVVYLLFIGWILHFDVVRQARPDMRFSPRLERAWEYRSLALHFCLGTLTNLYSIFFLMSASAFSTGVFLVLLFGAIALNEMRVVRQSGVDVKVGLFVLCVFCFFSLLIPIGFGRVGVEPFAWSMAATLTALGLFYYLLRVRLGARDLKRRLLLPGLSVSACFLVSYLAGVVPPVPIAAKKMGVYNLVERQGDIYALYREHEPWTFWHPWTQNIVARPGDRVYVFVAVYSPTRFDDAVFVRWMHQDPVKGWGTSDRLPLNITGGRQGGFRAYTTKQNYSAGRWQVSIETTDGREISRLTFNVRMADAKPTRELVRETY
jgi:hypothetical protein